MDFPQRHNLAARHRHAMNHRPKPKDLETTTRNLWYRAYRCRRVAFQAGILESSTDLEFYNGDEIGWFVAKTLESRTQ